jgi:hypothetical protein
VSKRIRQLRRLLIPVALLAAGAAGAAVEATVDRARVEQNESFTLELKVDSNADLTPDLSVLEDDFFIGQTSQLSNTSIINGKISRSRTWQISLMARRAGELTIPPITVGTEQSNPVSINVTEPTAQPPGEADVYITSEVDATETYVQAQVLYTIKIYRAVATRQPALREPTFGGAEVLVEIAGDEQSYEAVINSRAYNVVERTFAVFPQESGEISISPARFEARVLRNGRITGRKVFQSESQTITVNPIPAPPADHPDADWLPARDVRLTDSWSREPDQLRAGEPISRTITISALGQLETQIPVNEPPTVDGVNVYPDKPGLDRRFESGGIRGIRRDQYAMIANVSGDLELPAVELPWWDIDTGEWRVATLPARQVTILPSPAAPPPEPVATVETPPDAELAPPEPAAAPGSEFWKLATQILAIVWLATLVGWWWSTRPTRDQKEPAPVPLHRQQSNAIKAARRAAIDRNDGGVKQALMEWARLEWPDSPPRSIGELAMRVTPPLSDELERLSDASYGRGDRDWDGQALARALRSFSVIDEYSERESGEPLPPLMPKSAAG